jgi:phage-related protein
MADRDAFGTGAWGRPLGGPQQPDKRPFARVLFCIEGRRMVLLHGFIKKTQKTPQSDLNLALKRKQEIT